MGKYLANSIKNPIIFQAKRNHLTVENMALGLNVTTKTMNTYIKSPYMMTLRHLLCLSGLFKMSVEELVFNLVRCRQQSNEVGKWYLDEFRDRYKDLGSPAENEV